MNKQKLLFLAQLPPPVHGVTMMNKITVNSVYLNEHFNTKVIPLNYTDEIKGIGKFSWKKLFFFFINYIKIIKIIISFKPNIIYFTLTPTGISFYRDVLIVIVLKLLGKKITYHIHGKGINTKVSSSKVHQTIYSWVFKNVYVIHLSNGLIKDLSLLDQNFKTYAVANGINKKRKVINTVKNEECTLLFLSNIAENKGVYLFLNACSYLKEKKILFQAQIVGRETTHISKSIIQMKIDKLGLSSEVKYLGPKYDLEKEEILSRAHVFVFPTYNDCFPLVLLEAQKYGLPIVSSNEGAISEIVDNNINGFVVERKNQNELNTKLMTLVSDQSLILKFSKNSQKKFKNNYTTEIYEKNILSVLIDIADD